METSFFFPASEYCYDNGKVCHISYILKVNDGEQVFEVDNGPESADSDQIELCSVNSPSGDQTKAFVRGYLT